MILASVNDIQNKLERWAESLPEDWRYDAATGFDCPTDTPRETFIYGDRVEVYQDQNLCSGWNDYRHDRITILSIKLECIAHMDPASSQPFQQESSTILHTIQTLVDDICATVPYHMGTKTSGGPFDLPQYEYPYIGTVKASALQRRAAAALGGWYLIEPLRFALGAPGLRPGQREWMMAQIMRLARIYQFHYAATLLRNMRPGMSTFKAHIVEC